MFLLGDLYWHLGNRVSPATVILQSGWVALASGAYHAEGHLLVPDDGSRVLALSFRDGEPVATPAQAQSTEVQGLGRVEVFSVSGSRQALLKAPSGVSASAASQDGHVQIFAAPGAANLYMLGPRAVGAAPLLTNREGGIVRSVIETKAKTRKADGKLPYGWQLIWATSPFVSVDGHQIVYLSTRADPFGEHGAGLWCLNLRSGTDRQVVSPASVHDLRPIGFAGSQFLIEGENGDVMTVDLAKGTRHTILHGVDVVAYAPREQRLAYVRSTSAGERLFVQTIGQSEAITVNLPKGARFSGSASFSADGSRLAFVTLAGDSSEVTVVTLGAKTVLRETSVAAPSGQHLVTDLAPTFIDRDHLAVVTKAQGALRTWTLDLRAGPRAS